MFPIFFVVVVNASERDMEIVKAGEGAIFSTSCWYLNNGLPFWFLSMLPVFCNGAKLITVTSDEDIKATGKGTTEK